MQTKPQMNTLTIKTQSSWKHTPSITRGGMMLAIISGVSWMMKSPPMWSRCSVGFCARIDHQKSAEDTRRSWNRRLSLEVDTLIR